MENTNTNIISTKNTTVKVTYPAIPKFAREIDENYIIDYCVANGEFDFLQKMVNGKYVSENGKPMAYGKVQMVAAFCKAYFPTLCGKKEKKLPDWKLRMVEVLKANGRAA